MRLHVIKKLNINLFITTKYSFLLWDKLVKFSMSDIHIRVKIH